MTDVCVLSRLVFLGSQDLGCIAAPVHTHYISDERPMINVFLVQIDSVCKVFW